MVKGLDASLADATDDDVLAHIHQSSLEPPAPNDQQTPEGSELAVRVLCWMFGSDHDAQSRAPERDLLFWSLGELRKQKTTNGSEDENVESWFDEHLKLFSPTCFSFVRVVVSSKTCTRPTVILE